MPGRLGSLRKRPPTTSSFVLVARPLQPSLVPAPSILLRLHVGSLPPPPPPRDSFISFAPDGYVVRKCRARIRRTFVDAFHLLGRADGAGERKSYMFHPFSPLWRSRSRRPHAEHERSTLPLGLPIEPRSGIGAERSIGCSRNTRDGSRPSGTALPPIRQCAHAVASRACTPRVGRRSSSTHTWYWVTPWSLRI